MTRLIIEKRERLELPTVTSGVCVLLLITILGRWVGGGQEAIPYKNSEVNT